MLAPAGSLILWDNRLPHATAAHHDGPDTREVIFLTYLPDISRNRAYASRQLNNYFSQVLPPDFQGQRADKVLEEPDHAFSELGKCLMGLEPWPDEDEQCVDLFSLN